MTFRPSQDIPNETLPPAAPLTTPLTTDRTSPGNLPPSIESSGTSTMSERASGTAHDLFLVPLTWSDLVARAGERSAAIELEIGSGKGLFLQQAAAARPDHHFIGVELSGKFANRAADRLARSQLTNVHMLRGDAEAFLLKIVPDQSVLAVHVYFPDPWWRRKHKKRRVLNDDTLSAIDRILKPGGQFHFWTDVLDYYEMICGHVIEHLPLAGPHYVPERPATHDLDYTTHFERRARRHAQPIYRAVFAKPTL